MPASLVWTKNFIVLNFNTSPPIRQGKKSRFPEPFTGALMRNAPAFLPAGRPVSPLAGVPSSAVDGNGQAVSRIHTMRHRKQAFAKSRPPTAAANPKPFCNRTFITNFMYWASRKRRELSSAKVLNVVNAPRNPTNRTGKYAS